MASITYPHDFGALGGQPENVAQLDANFDAITDQVNGSLDGTNLSSGLRSQLGIPTTSTETRRGKSIIATEESRTNTAYGTLTTPDQVANVVLPTDGLIAVAYHALWKSSGAGEGRAAIFIGASQMQICDVGAPSTIAARTSTVVSATYQPLVSFPGGVIGHGGNGGATLVTTGLALASFADSSDFHSLEVGGTTRDLANKTDLQNNSFQGGVCHLWAAAGTYTVSVQFKAVTGSVTVKDRKLWVWVEGF